MPLVPYAKPWCSHADLVAKLAARGLQVADASKAEQFIAHVGYYRLSGYCLAFEVPGHRHSFSPGTSFEMIRAAYDFDFALRDLVNEALEVIEVDMRTTVAHYFGGVYGAFGHTNATNFFIAPPGPRRPGRRPFDHTKWLTTLRDEVKRSGERFVEHFRRTYTQTANDDDLPIWSSSEVMSFGCLSRMIGSMKAADRQMIANRYGLKNHEHVLSSWAHHVTVARNVCAHHGRLWERLWNIQPLVPAGRAWQRPLLPDNRRITVTLLILYQMLKNIPDVADWAALWQVRLRKKLAELPVSPVTPRLGFTDEWFANPVWQ